MLLRILLASTTEEENYIIRKKLDPLAQEIDRLQYLSVRHQGIMAAIDDSIHAVVLNTLNLGQEHLDLVMRLRVHGFNGAILVIAKSDNTDMVLGLNRYDNTIFLEKPYIQKDLVGLVRKMITSRALFQRVHRRYETDQVSVVEFLNGEGGTRLSRIVNLSRGGAYIEFEKGTGLRVGDRVKLRVPLDKMRREYDMPARIVWTAQTGEGSHGIGIEFVGPGDVRRRPLGSLS